MKSILVIIAIIVVVVCSNTSIYLLGHYNGQVSVEPQTVTVYQPEYVDRHIQTTVYVPEPYPIEVPVPYEISKEVPVYVDRVVETPTEYKPWKSVNEFIEWYGAQDFTVLMPSGAYKVDCDDYADRVQVAAMRDGRAVSQVLLNTPFYYGVKVRDSIVGHDACMILVHGKTGDKFYYVNPSPWSFKVIYIVNRD